MHAIASKFPAKASKNANCNRRAGEGGGEKSDGGEIVGETGDSRNENRKINEENENFKRSVGGICKSHYTSDANREIKIARMPIGIPRISRIRLRASPTRAGISQPATYIKTFIYLI